MMEADSTTYENNQKTNSFESTLPFPVHPGNLQFYKEITAQSSDGNYQHQLVQKLQEINLLPKTRECPDKKQDCRMKCVPARVVDRLQWMCPNCKTRLPVRGNSFFLRIHCTLLQSLQMILAWCQDADWEAAAKHFDVKPKVAYSLYDKLDQLSIDEHTKCKLGGENGLVLAEVYPDCLNRLSPDTTEHPHVHRVLMLADTNHIPTRYWLHVIKDSASSAEVCRVVKKAVAPGSTIVVGNYVPMITDAISLHTLTQHCDAEMQHFLCERIWSQAVSICAASRDICAGGACTAAVQKYLTASLYRLQYGDGFYRHILTLIATHHTKEDSHHTEVSYQTMNESHQTIDESHQTMVESHPTMDESHQTIDESQPIMDESQPIMDESQPIMDESHQTMDGSYQTMDESHQTMDESHLNVDDSCQSINETQNTMVETQRTMDYTRQDMEMEDSQNNKNDSQVMNDSEKTVDSPNTIEDTQHTKADLCDIKQVGQNTMELSHLTKVGSHLPMADSYQYLGDPHHLTDDSLHGIYNSQIDSSYYNTKILNHTIDTSRHAIEASHYNVDPTNYSIKASHYTADELNNSLDDSNNKDFYTLQNVPMVIEIRSAYVE